MLVLGVPSTIDVPNSRLSVAKAVMRLTSMQAYYTSQPIEISGTGRASEVRFFAKDTSRDSKNFEHTFEPNFNFGFVALV